MTRKITIQRSLGRDTIATIASYLLICAAFVLVTACSDNPTTNSDTGAGDTGATDADTGATDADTSDGATTCAADPTPSDDGTSQPSGGIPDLIISEFVPGSGGFIEFFNTTSSDIDLASIGGGASLCSRPNYLDISTLGNIVVPSKGFAAVDWPTAFTAAALASGEIAIYSGGSFGDSTQVLDYICWGSEPASSRKSVAETAGKWSGDCAGALGSGESLKRAIGTSGTSASDYSVSTTPERDNCTAGQ